jgi:CRP/FNR family nitrogen fixation transcriptional regulator
MLVSPIATNVRLARPAVSNHVSGGFLLSGNPTLVATIANFAPKEEIHGDGEPAEYVYQIIRGAARATKVLNDGRRHVSAFYLPGDVFGLTSNARHRLAAEAIVETTARVIKRRALEAAARTDARIACDLWATATADLGRAEERMVLLGRKTATERVASFLIEMDRRLAKGDLLPLPMCRRDIGDYLGLTIETVSRTLSRLHESCVLDFVGSRHVALRDRRRLAQMGEVG